MTGMIEMPPPEPPQLEADKIRALMDYADRMAAPAIELLASLK